MDEPEDMKTDARPVGLKRSHLSTDEEDLIESDVRSNPSPPKSGKNVKNAKKKVALKNVSCEILAVNSRLPLSDSGQSLSEGECTVNLKTCHVVAHKVSSSTITTDSVNSIKPDLREDTTTEHKISKYDAFCRGPFILDLRLSSTRSASTGQISAISISKKLLSANVKFSKIFTYSRNTWVVTFASKTLANNTLTNKILKAMGFSAFIPKYKLSRQIILKGIPMDVSLEEVRENIELENSNILVSKLYRLKRRERTSGLMVDSQSVCMEIRGETIPKSLILLKCVIPVSPYIPTVRMCYNCGRFGHLSKFCDYEERCLTCGGPHKKKLRKIHAQHPLPA